jgi:DNA-binding transcriptional MerR regulator
MLTKIMLPAAIFAMSATSAYAFHNSEVLAELDVDLTTAQMEALEEAHELRQDGANRAEIREVLEEAGFDRELLGEVRQAVREYRETVREAIRSAIEAVDYDDFIVAADGTKLGEVVDTEDEFELLVEAYERKEAGDREGAKEIMAELGIEKPERGHRHGGARPVNGR